MALLASGVLIVSLLGDALTTNGDFTGTPEAKQARTLIDEQLGRPDNVTEIVLVRSATMTVDDPAFEQRVTEIAIDLAAFNATVDTLYVNGAPDLVSPDRDPTMITIQLHNDSDENIEALVELGGRGRWPGRLPDGDHRDQRDRRRLSQGRGGRPSER